MNQISSRFACFLSSALLAVSIACGGATTLSPTGPTTISDTALAYIDELLAIMQANSINRHTLDWSDIRQRAIAAAGNAQVVEDVHRRAIPFLLSSLRDRHSLMLGQSGAVIAASSAGCNAIGFVTPTLPDDIGYVRVGGFSGSGGEAETFAARLHSTIVSADRDGLRGWIVDLRANTGGNMWPMLAGLAPILGEGVLGFFVHPDEPALRWEISGDAVLLGGSIRMRAPSNHALRRPSPLVAVLTDGLTASSGEAIVVAFRNRPNTRSFGTPTCGVSTANTGFPLSDRSTLVLTVAVMADRNGVTYGNAIVPDEVTSSSAEAARQAINWLQAP